MNNIIKYSIAYYYKKLNYKIIGILTLVLILFNIENVYKLNNAIFLSIEDINVQKNALDLYVELYVNSSTAVSILIFLSLYAIFTCFQNDGKEYFIKMRNDNSFKWFILKISSIFLFNLIINVAATLITLIIGMLAFGSDLNWSSLANMQSFSNFYSPIKFVLLNILTYSFFITFLAEIAGFLIIKLKNKKIVGSLVVIYLIVDRYLFSFNEGIVKILRYFSLGSYINFGARIYYTDEHKILNYFTMRESLEFSFVLFIGLIVLIKVIDKIVKVRK